MAAELLARAMGAYLADRDGLRATYLPDGVSEAFALELVREANRRRPLSPPFAIVIVGEGEGEEQTADQSSLRLFPQNAIRYRQDNRLAVVLGRHTDIASFEQSFRETLGPSYPAGEQTDLPLPEVSRVLVELIAREAGLERVESWNSESAGDRLASSLAQLSEIYQEQRDGSVGWNAQWFEHVTVGAARLVQALSSLADEEPGTPIDEAFKLLTYPSFGLPRPKNERLEKPRLGKAVADAIATYWADGDAIRTTAAHLAHHPDTGADVHPFAELDWSSFDQERAARDSFLLAWLGDAHDLTRTNAFVALTERQFFDPLSAAVNVATITVCDSQGNTCSVADTPQSIFVLSSASSLDSQDRVVYQSQIVSVEVPTLAPVGSLDEARSSVTLSASNSKVEFLGEIAGVSAASIVFQGTFDWSSGRTTREPSLVQSKVSVHATGELAGSINTNATCELVIAPPVAPILLYGRTDKRIGIKSVGYAGPNDIARQPDTRPEIHSATLGDPDENYSLVLVTSASDQEPLLDGRPMDVLNQREGLYFAQLSPSGINEVVVPGATFELLVDHPGSVHQSPIVAAVNREFVAADLPSDTTQESARGLIDVALGNLIVDEDWASSMGHIALPTNVSVNLSDIGQLRNGMRMSLDLDSVWDATTDAVVSDELLRSEAADDFRRAFVSLNVAERISVRQPDGTDRVEWLSRTSWRDLATSQRDALDQYLLSYANLIDHARALGDPMGVFWASYPFSASMWDTSTGKCRAVLLTPLHPLRLAWSAVAEATLWDADNASALAGIVEGWNFPVIGARESTNGRMLAVPTDNGEGQIFLGWSMLVEASIDGHESLVSPDRIGGRQAPGSAASGLNATAVAAALRDYRSMNPQLSTLTLDLAASSPSVRLDEIDSAVLSVVREWATKSASGLSGGSRVFDSLNRTGEPPRDESIRLARTLDDVPFVWSRYATKAGSSRPCNVRLLQDSGIRAEVGLSESQNLGIVAGVPLRRFEAPDAEGAVNGILESRPALRHQIGWTAFGSALIAAESGNSQPRISTRLSKSLLIDETADWTVSGETMMGPSAMSNLLSESSHGDKMLWEWRPPFLKPGRGIPALERRPFVSVARVPSGFRNQMRAMLAKASRGDVSDEQVTALMSTLGARGVGLSSLLSMGGTHASGALGFYLAFSLMQRVESEQFDRFVLPIDACDSFLTALSGGSSTSMSTRRADLLICELSDSGLVMSPVEIKFYGFDSEVVPPLPSPKGLGEALDQLESTTELLRRVVSTREQLAGWAELAVSNNGLAALIDAGARLRPAGSPSTGRFADRFQNLVDGSLEVGVGKPIVAYFRYQSLAPDGSRFVSYSGETSPKHAVLGEFGALVANVEETVAAIEVADSPLVGAWSKLVDWSFSSSRSTAEPSTGTALPDFETAARSESRGGEPPSPRFLDPIPPSAGSPDPRPADSPDPEPAEPDDLPSRDNDERPEPESLAGSGVKFVVGTASNTLGAKSIEFWPSNTELNQLNIGVVGDLGTGKTQLLKALITNLRSGAAAEQSQPLSFLIFDYKRDFQDAEFLEKVGGTVLTPFHIPLNLFSLSGEYTPMKALQKANFLYDVLARIYTGVGPVQRDRLVTTITSLYKENGGAAPVMSEVLERYRESAKADSVTSILNTFVLGEIFSEDRSVLANFEELIDDRVLVVALSDLGADSNAKNALVVLFLNVYYEYMLQSRKWPYRGTAPQLRTLNSFLLVDEATNIMKYDFPVLMDLMLQGREFGFGTILASQYLSHFRTSANNYGEPLLTWFIHKVPKVTAKELDQLGLTAAHPDVAEQVSRLRVHEALYSSLGYEGVFIEGTPFFRLP